MCSGDLFFSSCRMPSRQTMGGVCELEHLAQRKFYPVPSQRYSLAVLCQRLLSRHVRALSTARANSYCCALHSLLRAVLHSTSESRTLTL